MVVGDGAIVRAGLDALLGLMHKFAAPTGARGSILLMTGGLIVLGFLFLAFLFRSAIVGDLAPVANARAPTPRVLLPHETRARPPPGLPSGAFEAGRARGREADPALDAAFEHLRLHGVDARIVQSRAAWKRVRAHACASCEGGVGAEGCDYERGLLAGAFERVSGELAKVHESRCRARGDPDCEFEVRHAPFVGARA